MRRYVQLCAFAGLLSMVLLVGIRPAQASNCSAGGGYNGTGYYYSGQQQAPSWLGIEGYISVDTLGLGYGGDQYNHILILQELKNFGAANCTGYPGGNCWLQDGYGEGNMPSPCGAHNGGLAYEENNDINGYDCTWETSISLNQDDFWNVYFGGTRSGTNAELVGYINTGSGPRLIGAGWMPDNGDNLTATALTEVYDGTLDSACPSIAQYEYFGSNGSGTTGAKWDLYLSNDGAHWNTWTQKPSAIYNNAPYNHFFQTANYFAFSAYGS